MKSKKGSKGGRSQSSKQSFSAKKKSQGPALTEEDYDEIDRFHRARDDGNISLDPSRDEEDEDDGGDVGVFQLDVDSDSDTSSEGDDDDDEEGDEDEEVPQATRKPVKGKQMEVSGLLSDEEDDSSEDEEDRLKSLKWGKNKQQYYNADATDLEIGQDFADAEEEERAVREQERARFSNLDEHDFGLGPSLLQGAVTEKGKAKKKGADKKDAEKIVSHSAALQVGEVETQEIARKVNKLSKSGKLQVLMTESPELLVLLEEFGSRLEELKDKVEPIVSMLSKGAAQASDDTVAYLEVKQQLLLSYCINVTFYMLLKAEGKSVQDHPVIQQLMELRTAMEKMKPLDAKLRYQVERLLKAQAQASADGDKADPLSFRPNPDALIGRDAEGDDGAMEVDDERDGGAAGVYRAPRLAAVPYDGDNGDRSSREEERRKKKLEKIRRSEIHQTLLDEFSEKPDEVVERSFSEKERRLQEEMAERTRFEEERFVRLVTSKKERKQRKQLEREATRLETIADIGNFQEFEESGLGALAASNAAGVDVTEESEGAGPKRGASSTAALQKAVNALTQKEASKRRKRDEVLGDADVSIREPAAATISYGGLEDEDGAPMSKRAKKKAKLLQRQLEDEQQEGGSDFDLGDGQELEDDDWYEAVAEQQAKKREAKKAKYTAEPNYGGAEDLVGDEEKRGINYEIEKNRGLTAYKNKLNRNPRVKKREAYRKAVIRRKGQVRDVRPSEFVGYGGEATGINAKVVRTRVKSKTK